MNKVEWKWKWKYFHTAKEIVDWLNAPESVYLRDMNMQPYLKIVPYDPEHQGFCVFYLVPKNNS